MKWNISVLLAIVLGYAVAAPRAHVERDSAKYVFAHFMVGIVPNYEVADWITDMEYAMEIGIDAFALNNANVDSFTPTQLANAYEAAEEIGFKVFISFDFSYWSNSDTSQITAYMQQYANHPAQMQYSGGAVSPSEATSDDTSFDGVFSWYAWPTNGDNSIIPGPMTTVWDDEFITDLAGKPYMAPVSPWFSTHFASKNWVFICEELITDRWNEMLQLQPQLIEIVTWNDFGESHYISPSEPNHADDGSSEWAAGFPHDGWRMIMKPYIAAYKAGASSPSVSEDQLVYWYRPTPWDVTCTSDSLGPPDGRDLLADVVFVTTMLTSAAQLTVTSGSNAAVTINVAPGIVTNNFTMGLGAQSFQVLRNGVSVLGGTSEKDITNTCAYYNYNAYVGSFNATGGSATPTSSISSSSSTSSSAITSPSSSTVCTAGTGSGNYIGLCNFCCEYGYCPSDVCTCTSYGTQVPLPPATGQDGHPLSGEDDSYLGLCSFAGNYGYCPGTACTCS
ncbi:hypothetical protein B7494_g4548 [Chlorociboria aeruginascens]|nr:hypothetical protein B7494_g4548 [Chlorociboria aeruginascens]